MQYLPSDEVEDEVFEAMGELQTGVVEPGEGVHALTARDVEGVIDTAPVNARAAFEVFMGQVYDSSLSSPAPLAPSSAPTQNSAHLMAVKSAIEARLRGSGGGARADAHLSAGGMRLGGGDWETPLQKYTRLVSETAALEAELQAFARTRGVTGSDAGAVASLASGGSLNPQLGIWPSLTQGVAQLSSRLESLHAPVQDATMLHLSASRSPAAAAASPTSTASLRAAKLAHAASVAAAGDAAAGHDATEPAGEADSGARRASALAAATLPALETRLAALEAVLLPSCVPPGAPSPTASSHTAPLPPSLEQRMDALERLMTVLARDGAETLNQRAAAVSDALKGAGLTGTASPAAVPASGVSVLPGGAVVASERLMRALATLERWDGVAAALPSLVARLTSLRGVHTQAAGLVHRVSVCEETLAAARASLDADSVCLREVASGLRDNAATMDANFAALRAQLPTATGHARA